MSACNLSSVIHRTEILQLILISLFGCRFGHEVPSFLSVQVLLAASTTSFIRLMYSCIYNKFPVTTFSRSAVTNTLQKHAYSNILKTLPPKNEKIQMKNSDIHNSAQNIDCGYSLEPPMRGGSNEYPKSMFFSRNKKNYVYPCKP